MKPPLINTSIENIEFSINAAKNDYLVDQWMCDFFGKVLFGMQLWRTNQLGWELKGFTAPDSEKCLNAFVASIERELKYFKMLIPRIKDRMSDERDETIPATSCNGVLERPEKK